MGDATDETPQWVGGGDTNRIQLRNSGVALRGGLLSIVQGFVVATTVPDFGRYLGDGCVLRTWSGTVLAGGGVTAAVANATSYLSMQVASDSTTRV